MTSSPLSSTRARLLAISESLYRRALVCVPAEFRDVHGNDAALLFRDKMRTALRRGLGLGAIVVLVRSLLDILREGVGQRFHHDRDLRSSPQRPRERIMESIRQDFRFALRMVRKQPALSALVIITLALGIGANTTVFSYVNAVFLADLPVAEVDTLIAVHGTVEEGNSPGGQYNPISWPNYEDMRDQNSTLDGLAAWGFEQAGLSDDTDDPVFEPVQLVSANYFDVMGIEPHLGRLIEPSEEEPVGVHAVVVLGHAIWQERYGGDVDVVGRVIRLNGHPFTVVGVAPEGFGGTNVFFDARLWAPMSMHPQLHAYSQFVDARRWRMFQLAGRLAEGTTMEQAAADLRSIAVRLAEEYPDDNRGRYTNVTSLAFTAIGPNQREVFVAGSVFLFAVAGIVLAIACANVANLMLARARGRHREMAVRLSLGAGRMRILRQLASEAVLLSALGGLASIVVAIVGRDLLWAYRPPGLTDDLEIGFDMRVLAVTTVLAIGTGVAFALIPALRSSRVDAASALREGSTSAGDRRGRLVPLRSALVVVQVALSFLAVIGAGLFLTSLQEAQKIDPGFDVDHLLLAPVNPSAQGYEQEQSLQFYEQLEERAASLPGIKAVGFASNPPLTPTFLSRTTIREGDPEDQSILIGTNAVSPGFFAAMELPLVNGRIFTAADREETRRVIVINDVMAERLWPGEDPLAKRVRFLGEQEFFEVIGVVGSLKYNSLGEDPQPYFYHPVRQRFADAGTLHVLTEASPSALAEPVRSVVRELDPQLPLTDFTTAAEGLELSLWAPRMGASLLSIFGGLSLTLAVVGIYGVLAQLVAERRREIGIRIALGADRGSVVGLVGRQTFRWLAIGGALGGGAALAASRWLGAFLYGIDGADLRTYVVTAVVLFVAGIVATGLPARRAAAVDPAVAMRQE